MIGFCGHVNGSLTTFAIELLWFAYRNTLHFFHKSHFDYQKIFSSSRFRYKVINSLRNKSNTNFVTKTSKTVGPGNAPYFNNLLNSDFILCIRGSGNFSKRFYESLAMGRIPMLIDTECILPFSNKIKWDQHIISVKFNDIKHIDILITQFLSSRDINEIKASNRKLFKEFFSENYFVKLFDEITK